MAGLNLITDETWREIKRLLNQYAPESLSKIRPGRLPQWALVQCNDDAPLDTDGSVREQVFPATIIRTSANEIYPDTDADRAELYGSPVLLTVLTGTSTDPNLPVFAAPQKGAIYTAILTTEFQADRSGSGSSIVLGRTRAFAAALPSSGSVYGNVVQTRSLGGYNVPNTATWQNPSFATLAIPSAGDYELFGTMAFEWFSLTHANSGRVWARVYNVTDGSEITGAYIAVEGQTTTDITRYATGAFVAIVTIDGPKTLRWEGYASGPTGFTVAMGPSLAIGLEPQMGYRKLN